MEAYKYTPTYCRKWNEHDITIKLNNLRKLLGDIAVDGRIACAKMCTRDYCDALNIAYYNLKRMFCKINGGMYGKYNNVEYQQYSMFDDNCYVYYYSLYGLNTITASSYITTDSTMTVNTYGIGTYMGTYSTSNY